MRYALVAFLPFLITMAHADPCEQACEDASNCLRSGTISGKSIDFYSNFSLNNLNECIEKVIFVVHGAERNARSRYQAVLDAAKSENLEDRVLIISPFFKTSDDEPGNDELYWSSSGWRQGNTSIEGEAVSSFTVADRFLTNVITRGRFPNLTSAVVTGHSAGGQYAQMYALTSTITQENDHVNFRFLVLNPSNYAYLNGERPHPVLPGVFEEPVYEANGRLRMKTLYRLLIGNCPTSYNDYKYGLLERNSYALRLSANELIDQYLRRSVFYFLGELDANVADPSMDTSCEANIQGPHRLARGRNYFNFLNTFFDNAHNHSLGVVDGVGHDARGMYGSNEVKEGLFAF